MESASRIPEKLFFRIGEVCELIKVQPHVLRYWETEFPMLAPQKNRAGQRVYRRKDVEMVFRIHALLYEEKFTIAGAKKKLLDEMRGTSQPKPKLAEPSADDIAQPNLPGVVVTSPDNRSASPETRRVLRAIKSDLEDLLTRLTTDASIKR